MCEAVGAASRSWTTPSSTRRARCRSSHTDLEIESHSLLRIWAVDDPCEQSQVGGHRSRPSCRYSRSICSDQVQTCTDCATTKLGCDWS